jgi:glycerol-3-phosphate O-acyltransferase / dihydroxyacetone phosphate acyltransferase
LADLAREFAAPSPDASRLAVKKLTKLMEQHLVQLTINAPDWETLYAARMARELLWVEEHDLNLDEFVSASQM